MSQEADPSSVAMPNIGGDKSSPSPKSKCDWQKVSKTCSVILGTLLTHTALALITLGVLNLINIFTIVSPLEYILSIYYV